MSLMVNVENDLGSELEHSFTEKSLSYVSSSSLLISVKNCILLMFDCHANFSLNFILLIFL